MTKQLPHLVFGGQLKDPSETDFVDLSELDLVGIYGNYQEAYKVWREKSSMTVDDTHTKYFIVHLHRMLDPEEEKAKAEELV
ncbi:MAG TPA: DUF4170 domain-containing protein [Sneathiellales bacterium]|nr:DUF4170 domain-containing protein [Sneathiellales bacterium]